MAMVETLLASWRNVIGMAHRYDLTYTYALMYTYGFLYMYENNMVVQATDYQSGAISRNINGLGAAHTLGQASGRAT